MPQDFIFFYHNFITFKNRHTNITQHEKASSYHYPKLDIGISTTKLS